ncbi:MFS transporter [Actinoplanes sp. KI2]|uniref:MFS transporter n=1 Tax=Actinoplanes sp. KI2 TaxID=2983315 RepID=UPI0021D58145|nr:MFS transporter [Actinoplanes sp. KI2]MCU7728886.1 MFS transporter [Actinoplanes sp. KI2]
MTVGMKRLPRAGATLALVTVGLGLNLRASVLLGPHLHERFGVTPGSYLALIGLPVLVAAVVRLPVGVLTDRYGVRVMLPAVSLVAAVSVVALGLADSVPAAAVAGAVAGTGSSAFVVGAALVSKTFSYGRRGLALGVFGLGAGLGALFSVVSWHIAHPGRLTAVLLGGSLVGFAVLAAVVIREPVPVERAWSPLRECAALVRLASTSSVSLLYLVALGGMLSVALFLPVYLTTALGLEWPSALLVTGFVVALASAARLLGGWRTDRHPTARLLVVCYGIAAGLCLVVAVAPRWWVAVVAISGMAVCDAVAGGALLALIGKAARPYSIGAVMGVAGAAGALGALIPPLLIAGLHRLTGSYTPAWALLAAILLAAALYVRSRDLHVGLGLAVGFRPGPSPTATTVAVLGEPETRSCAAAVVAELAELATSDELVVVYGVDEPARLGLSAAGLASGLRSRLPRHSVVVMPIDEHPDLLGRDALRLGEHVEAGSLAIAVTSAARRQGVAADLSIYLQADRVLTVSYDRAAGAELHPA